MKYLRIISVLLICVLLFASCGLTKSTNKNEAANNDTQMSEAPKDPNTETPSGTAPGLYNEDTGALKYSWDELLARKFITVKDNFITGAVVYLRGDLYIPNGILGISKSAFKGTTGLKNVSLGDGVTTIGDSAFYGCTGLASVTLGKGLTNISSKAFAYCTRLKTITIPDSVTNIGASAFQSCTGLAQAHIGNGVTNISKSAFSGCTGLLSVKLGKEITYIGASAFHNCAVLASVEFNGKLSQWNSIYIDKKNTALTDAALKTNDSRPAGTTDQTTQTP